MGTEVTGSGAGGLFDEIKQEMASFIDKGFAVLETEQSKVNKAFFDALTMQQRDTFCQSLEEQGVKSSRIERITGKSQPTVNRHLNGKNS
ncbi:hypothetical protein [Pseudomonas aeruginosa]|uniref:hypothetical protein n=1 Tax=Pseudomonas aeruginosa TaxID=287 RepID=UPI000941719F|nr:hypothetical protein [Pseudomonas aeruginosa]OKS22339.1 hypothetical protein BH607_07690 [Pseudomonas aeruginosa]